MIKRLWWALVSVAALITLMAPPAAAQATEQARQPRLRARGSQGPQRLPVAEVERLFDGYVAMQAQEALKLSDAQYPQFLARLKVLQETRRRNLHERRLLVAELDKTLQTTPVSEATLRDLLRREHDLAGRNAEELQRAYDGIDQVLDLPQQARFRVFEESVERRKLDLVLRARRAAAERQIR